ncbi:MAG: methyltransferase family protein [Candidatus Binataceae bacterium]
MFILKLVAGVILNSAIFGVLLFVPAGTLSWWRAWVFIGVVFVCAAVTMFGVFARNEELLDERYRAPIQKGQPLADKIILLVLVTSFAGCIVFIPLDVFRFRLMVTPGVLVSLLGLALIVAGWWIIALALKANAFAAPVVKHQEERQQTVVDSSVYGIVRHPMYAGAIPFIVGIPLWLGSYAAALLTIVPIGTIVLRILIEEQFLRRELKGYAGYTERVRHRMVPFVW